MPDNLDARFRKLVNQTGLKHVQGGLTLLKIMVVVAIIGILAEVALSAYQNYIARAQVTEAFTFITEIKTPIAKFYTENGTWPTTHKFNSLMPTQTGKYIATIIPQTLASGFQITATFKDSEVSAVLVSSTMVLATTSDLKWVCDDSSVRAIGGKIGTAPSKYRPEVCK
jgi:type IV pilus assembly protein PilA